VSSQVNQSEKVPLVGDASVGGPTANRAAFLCGLLQQFLCGCAIVLPFLWLQGDALQGSEATWVSLSLATLLIAMGIGFPLQSWIGRTAGLHVAARFGLLSVAAGVSTVTCTAPAWGILCGCLLIGFGLHGDWTPSAEMTRRALLPTQLWRGMRIHGAMFFVGALLVIIIHQWGNTAGLMTVSCVVVLACVVNAALLRPARSVVAPVLPDGGSKQSCNTEVPETTSPLADSSEQKPEDCEAEECCGGGCEWTPMSVALGACLAFVAIYALGLVVTGTVTQGHGTQAMMGAVVGFALFQAVVPTAGYAVLLVPCCLLGMIAFGIAPWTGLDWQGLLLSVQGGFAAAIYCGCSGLTGESFTDSCQGNSRTTVLMIGSMAAAAVGLVQGVLITFLSPDVGSLVTSACCLLAILFLRRIPSLMVSQRRQEECSAEEAEEMLAETFGAAEGSLE